MRKKIVIERDPGEEPNCSSCNDIPLWGCVACPTPRSRNEEILDEIESIVNVVFQSGKDSLANESRKRYNALLEIRKILRLKIHRGKKNDR